MKGRVITKEIVDSFYTHLLNEEKSAATVEKYMRDVKVFAAFAAGNEVAKELVIAYKQKLTEDNYAVRSINSVLASLNSLFAFMDWHDCRVKSLKLQREIFCSEEKELTKAEYLRLCEAAQRKNNDRLYMILQTICCTGIRVSELKFITVEAAKRGIAKVNCKGKNRQIIIIKILQKKLLKYAQRHHIYSGCIFVTKTGKPMSRTNIWREMKQLCREANVSSNKVFPHNLRHLFARCFYAAQKDIAKLADILGHSSINTTRIYIISTADEHRRMMENMRLVC